MHNFAVYFKARKLTCPKSHEFYEYSALTNF
jgi:hypothetical protein